MSVVKKIKDLAYEKGINIAALEREIGLANGAIYKWDKSSPTMDKLKKVADYFNVSLDYFLDKMNQEGSSSLYATSTLTDKEEKDVAKTMRKLREQLMSEQGLMFDGEVLDKETAQLLLEAIEQQERIVKFINRKYTRKDYRK